MTWFDQHCHLPAGADSDEVVADAAAAGVSRLLTVGTDLEHSRQAIAVAQRHQSVWATVGVHPHDAHGGLDGIVELLDEPSVVAVGEAGLDFHYDHSPHPAQEEAFRRQIAIAKELKKPLVIHTRSAPEDTLRILREERAKDVGGIIHCFSEDAPFAKAALDLGFVSSFSGIVTFNKAVAVQDAAIQQPADALLIETDAPYLAPMPKRGKRNEPAYVAYTAARIAELRGEDPEALAQASYENAVRIFGIHE